MGKVQSRILKPHQISKSKKKKSIQIGQETTKLDCCGQDSHLGESTISYIESTTNFQAKEKNLFKSVQKQRNLIFVFQTVIWWKYNIEFGIPIKIPSKRNRNYSNRSRNNENGLMWSGKSFLESTTSKFESPLNFQVNIEIGQETTK